MELYLTGIILKPKGLKGELKIQPVTDFPESFLRRRHYHVGRTPEETVIRRVLSSKLSQGFAWLVLEGIATREDAEAIAGCRLYVTTDELEPLPDDRAYLHDLIGLEVFDQEQGRVGMITDVLPMPAQDVYEIDTGSRKVLVPAVDDFIKEIDLEKGIMILRRFSEFL